MSSKEKGQIKTVNISTIFLKAPRIFESHSGYIYEKNNRYGPSYSIGYSDDGQVDYVVDSASHANFFVYAEDTGRRTAVTNALNQVTHSA